MDAWVDLSANELVILTRGLASLAHWARDDDLAEILALRERLATALEGVNQ
jgi:hypothetical protein